MQCFTCRQIFQTHQELFSHIQSFHNEIDDLFLFLRRQHSMCCLRHNLRLNSTLPQITFFQNHYHNHNQTRRFQPVTMANNNNTNSTNGRFVHPQVRAEALQLMLQPQSHFQPQLLFQPQPMQPQLQPQLLLQPQPAQPQPQPQLQPQVLENETLVNHDCTLPLIEQLEREWPSTIVLVDDEKDSIDLELKL